MSRQHQKKPQDNPAALQETFNLALQNHQAGRLAEAEALYRKILAADAKHSDAMHLLGLIIADLGRRDEGISLIEQAIALRPDGYLYYSNLGNILRGAAPPTRERLDAVRAWGSTQAPDTVDAITGDVLATAAQLRADFSFDDAAGLALQFSQSGGSDEVLAAFLDTWYARNHQEQARAWAGQIADETRREAILKGLN